MTIGRSHRLGSNYERGRMEKYASNMLFNCSLNGFMVLLFFACLLNGSLAAAKGRRAETMGLRCCYGRCFGERQTVLSAALVQWTETLLVAAAFAHGTWRWGI